MGGGPEEELAIAKEGRFHSFGFEFEDFLVFFRAVTIDDSLNRESG